MKTRLLLRTAPTYPVHAHIKFFVWKRCNFSNTSATILYPEKYWVLQKCSKFPHFLIFPQNFFGSEMYLGVCPITFYNCLSAWEKANRCIFQHTEAHFKRETFPLRACSLQSNKNKCKCFMDHSWRYFTGSTGNNDSIQTSGAYIFRPNNSIPNDVCEGNKARVEIVKGPLVQEVRQTFGTFVSQVIRLVVSKSS